MNDAIRKLMTRVSRPSVEGRRRRFVATVLVSATVAGGIPVLAALQSDAMSDVRGAPGSFWLSGEAKAQVVLAATGGELASLALETGLDEPAELDVVDTGSQVVVHDRKDGKVLQVDGIEGKIGRELSLKATPTSPGPALVQAGADAWLVDVDGRRATRLTVDPKNNETLVQPTVSDLGQFDQWVGTADGVLWLLDTPKGQLRSVDGDRVTDIDFSKPGLDLVLSALGDDPVVLDRSTGRVRWPRAASSNAIADFTGEALLQQPTTGGSCITVITPTAWRCFTRDTEARSGALDVTIPDFRGGQVFANEENIVVGFTDRPDVFVANRANGSSWSVEQRREVSGRPLVSHFTPGALMVDDPGARYAVTADRGEVTELDKFNQRTVLLSVEGTPSGAGVAAATGDGPGGDGTGDGAADEVIGTGQVFDDANAPDPRDDTAITRVKRKKQIDVLANDFPHNGALAVKSVTLLSGDGKADVVDGSSVLFTPLGNFPGQAELTYTVVDSTGRTGTADIHVEIKGDDQNTAPVLQDDEAPAVTGVRTPVDVLQNDSDAEGDPLAITKVVDPLHGVASVDESGIISYTSDPGFQGTDTFRYTVNDGYEAGESTAVVTMTVTAATLDNRPPVPQPDRAVVTAGKSVQLDALANDTDPDGDVLRIVDVSAPATSKLTVSVLASQQVSIVAAEDAPVGLVQVVYSVADTAVPAHRVQSSIAVFVQPATKENRPPIAVDDTLVVTQDNPKTFNITANDSDPDGDPLTITSLNLGDLDSALGSVRRVSQSSIEFTPAAGRTTGTTKFTYVVSDPNRASATGTVTIQLVESSNSGPIAKDDVVKAFDGSPVKINVLANDSHPDGLPISLAGLPSFSVGNVTVNADQSVTFTPPSADPRTYNFSYTIKDPNGRTASAQVVVVIEKVTTNSVPVAINDQVTTTFGTAKTIDVLANDSDPDGQAIDITAVGAPSAGTATITARQIRYTPPATFSGIASFTYTISDKDGNTATATVVVQVLPAAKIAPTARDDLFSMLTGKTADFDVLANDSDPDGPASALVLSPNLTPPAGIGATVVAGKIRVTSSGAGSFVIPYTVLDADGLSAAGKLTVSVSAPANQPPVAVADSVTTNYSEPILIAVLGNDTDPEGGQLSLGTITAPLDDANNPAGSARAVGTNIRYDPGSYAGGVVTFTYVVSDDGGRTAVGTVRVVVSVCSAATPTPNNDQATAARGQTITINVLGNDNVVDGSIQKVEVSDPTGGRASVNGSNVVVYTAPAAGGTYTFTYFVTNKCGVRSSATVTVTVNRAPIAVADNYTFNNNDGNETLNVLGNDSDPDGDTYVITKVTPDSAANITNGGRALSFRVPTTVQTVTFTYTISDCTSTGCNPLTSTAQVTISVVQPNRNPVAVDDRASMVQGDSSLLINVVGNDTDPDNNALILTDAFVMVSPVNGGSITREGNQARFTPANSCTTGSYVFTYWVTDGQGQASGDQGTVTVSITPQQNVAPVGVNDSFTTAADQPVTMTFAQLAANDTDANKCDFGKLTVGTFGPPSGGSLAIGPASVTFTPTPGFAGTATFTYLVKDPAGLQSTATVSITVEPPPTTTTQPPTTTAPPATTAPPTTAAPTVPIQPASSTSG